MKVKTLLSPTGYPLLKLSGRLTFEDEYADLHRQIERFASSQVTRVVLDLGAVECIDSAGIGELIRAYQDVSRDGRRLVLLNSPKPVAELFHRAGLNFLQDDDESMGTASFRSSASNPPIPVEKDRKPSQAHQAADSFPELRKRPASFWTPFALLTLSGLVGAADGLLESPLRFEAPVQALLETLHEGEFRQPPKKQKRKKQENQKKNRTNDEVIVIVRDYYAERNLPPGLAKRDRLPPGLERQLAERGTLPPGLQKRLYAVPSGMTHRLAPVPADYRWYFLGDNLVLVDRDRRLVARIVADVLP